MKSMRERKQLRLKDYDYAQPGAYFVTICTKDRVYRFGEIVDGQMNENDLAVIVRTCWNDLPNHYLNVQLDEFVIMPNHVHGIIVIVDEPNTVGNGHRPSPTKKHPLSEIVRAFKSFSARRINEINGTPGASFWQRGYYDHIIRNDLSLTRIRLSPFPPCTTPEWYRALAGWVLTAEDSEWFIAPLD